MDQTIKKHYGDLFCRHNDSIHAVQWSDKKTQEIRFKILLESVLEKKSKIVDLGCGLGHLYSFLKSEYPEHLESYIGVDFVEEFINTAKSKYCQETNAQFEVLDVQKDELPRGFDYFLMSGVFFIKTPQIEKEIALTLQKSFEACQKGIAFNMLSTYVDYQQDIHYHADPKEIFEYCKKNLTPKVIIRHDYRLKENTIPYEFTVYLYK